MKNILITGNRGFIGSHLERKLVAEGYRVYGIDLPDSDITEEKAFSTFYEIAFEKVFHLAGRTYVPDSWKEPDKFYHNNFSGTLRVLQFCKSTVTPLTFVSCYIYGHPLYLPIDEKHPVQPLNPYNHSKFLCEQLCLFYQEHFDVSVVIIRPFNIYGPRQRKDFLIPTIIDQLKDPLSTSITINNLVPKRDYLYIDDFLGALMKTMLLKDGIFNVGSGISYSVKDIIKIICEVYGIEKPLNITSVIREDEIEDLYCDITKIKNQTNWFPSTSFIDGISQL